jgi:hypothetical protein
MLHQLRRMVLTQALPVEPMQTEPPPMPLLPQLQRQQHQLNVDGNDHGACEAERSDKLNSAHTATENFLLYRTYNEMRESVGTWSLGADFGVRFDRDCRWLASHFTNAFAVDEVLEAVL